MKNHPLYKKLKQIALDRNYTVEQAQALDFNQAAELLETRSFSLTFLINMKYGVIDTLRHRDDENDLQQLKETTQNWLDTNFPDWEAERGRQGNKPYITIWLRGKP
ncbi:MAG: hypothetical protein ACYSWZ_22410 [Planctomycetota bacterium]|jgi:hypothetical protein